MSVQKEVRTRKDGTKYVMFRARTVAGSKSFIRERDAKAYDEEIKRRCRFGRSQKCSQTSTPGSRRLTIT